MADINNENRTDPTQMESSASAMEDWEMAENLTDRKGHTKTLLRYMAISFVIGTLVFIAVAYGLHYFQTHYGASFFAHGSGN